MTLVIFVFSQAVKNACDMLVTRMAPYKKKKMTWEELVAECQKNQVDLHATYQ